jgi:hypothetical protein
MSVDGCGGGGLIHGSVLETRALQCNCWCSTNETWPHEMACREAELPRRHGCAHVQSHENLGPLAAVKMWWVRTLLIGI